jgi:hypothetical protein
MIQCLPIMSNFIFLKLQGYFAIGEEIFLWIIMILKIIYFNIKRSLFFIKLLVYCFNIKQCPAAQLWLIDKSWTCLRFLNFIVWWDHWYIRCFCFINRILMGRLFEHIILTVHWLRSVLIKFIKFCKYKIWWF